MGGLGGRPVRTRVPRAGKRLTASARFVQLETGQPVADGDVHCRATVGARRLRVVVNAFRDGAATCAWRVPAALSGEKLTGVVAVQVDDANGLRVFVRKIA